MSDEIKNKTIDTTPKDEETVDNTVKDEKTVDTTIKEEIPNAVIENEALPRISSGDTVQVYQKIKINDPKNKKKERIQVFEGLVIAKKHGKGSSGTITVRRAIAGVGVEKIFPIHSPSIKEIKVLKRGKVRRSKLYYIRKAKGKKSKIKERIAK